MEKKEAEHDRKIRNQIYDGKSYPRGDDKINPAKKRTAAEYHDWLRTQTSHQMQSGAHLSMLEREEVAMGDISYPPGHPRRASLEAGRDPDMDELRARGKLSETPSLPPPKSPSRSSENRFAEREVPLAQVAAPAAPRVSPPLRSNKYAATCVRCGDSVAPGEGSLTRDPEKGWVTMHNNHPKGE